VESLNLPSIVGKEGGQKVVIEHRGYLDKDRFYFSPGKCILSILPNNLSGGYIGNTLLVPLNSLKNQKSNILIDLNGYLFFHCILKIEHKGLIYSLQKRNNFLRIKGIILKYNT
jgi:hypothetical protein